MPPTLPAIHRAIRSSAPTRTRAAACTARAYGWLARHPRATLQATQQQRRAAAILWACGERALAQATLRSPAR